MIVERYVPVEFGVAGTRLGSPFGVPSLPRVTGLHRDGLIVFSLLALPSQVSGLSAMSVSESRWIISAGESWVLRKTDRRAADCPRTCP